MNLTILVASYHILMSRYDDASSTSIKDKKDKDGNQEQLSAVSDNHPAHSCNFYELNFYVLAM